MKPWLLPSPVPGPEMAASAHLTSSKGQVNRVRCGQLGHEAVVVAVDAAGGVLVAASQLNSKLQPMRLLNVAPGRDQVGKGSEATSDETGKIHEGTIRIVYCFLIVNH